MSATNPPNGWRLAAGCLAGVAVTSSLVVWRSLHTDGGWLLAVRLTGLLAVLGLLAAMWVALRPLIGPPRELVLRVSAGSEGPTTETVTGTEAAPPGQGRNLRMALALALATVAPVLVVVVLAVPAGAVSGTASGPASAGAAQPTTSTQPTSTQPTLSVDPSPPGDTSSSDASSSGAPTSPAEPTLGADPSGPTTGPAEPPVAGQPADPTGPAEAPSGEVAAGECPTGAAPQAYAVVAGDSLWAIAERGLLGSGTPQEIDAEWRLLYERNRAVIGADPDLILPGQSLLACR